MNKKRLYQKLDTASCFFVRMIGVEPTRLAAPDPKSGASANFATSAFPLPGGKSRGFTQKIMVKLVPLFGSLVTEIVPPNSLT